MKQQLFDLQKLIFTGENAPVDQANQQQQPKQSTWGVIMGTLQRMFFMWMIMNFFRG